MNSGPKGSEQRSQSRCGVCGKIGELYQLPERSEKYCLSCSADVAISVQLTAEIDAATLSGQEASALVAEFAELSERLLARAQSI